PARAPRAARSRGLGAHRGPLGHRHDAPGGDGAALGRARPRASPADRARARRGARGRPVSHKAAGTRHAHARSAPRPIGLAILTVSDTRRGVDDLSGNALERLFGEAGHRVAKRAWSGDSIAAIRRATRALLARRDVEVVVVTGGTGIAPRDVTPEAL